QKVIHNGCQAIVLIPEIALTHQTLARFRAAFPDRITILHSRMSAGERYDQFMRIYRHEVDIVIGPRSALFVPFDRLGLIVMDEEHENSYQSEKNPTYHARDVAAERARRAGASLILGSATPSVKSYYQAMNGKYRLIRLSHRASGADRPSVYVVDLRDELKAKNRSIFSRLLHEKIRDRLDRHEQIMLFINRRGYAGFVSCRSCGYVIKCSHCDVSMTEHGRQSRNPRLICHYCGDTAPMPSVCPSCGSPYIASFGMGTEKVCELAKKEFPDARIIRMDADTTRNKDGHERILSVFREHGADILVGTQMIAKGHDIGNVTLVGAIAADMSLYQDDYRSFERTYQLLEQAGGRSGRSSKPGEFIIQTYNPDSYCIEAVASDRPDFFYESELSFRRLAGYPPYRELMKIRISSEDEKKASEAGVMIDKWIRGSARDEIVTIGPAPEKISFVGDRFRYSLFVKTENANTMDGVISMVTENINNTGMNRNVSVIFERT
ncbi:MAG: primosomal protein N', partial [Eubacterium sp.]|nr:primosomal protein N' [Eubacterium sp.]